MPVKFLSVLLGATCLTNPIMASELSDLISSQNILWKEVLSSGANTVAIGNPVKYFQYSYKPSDRFVHHTTQQNDTADSTINADFIQISSENGSALLNKASLQLVKGDFINNSLNNTSSEAMGGAFYEHQSTVSLLHGDFVGNKVSSSQNASGGAIGNDFDSDISEIKGNFIANSAETNEYANGGAIYNAGSHIGKISGNFIANKVKSENQTASGGAIYNDMSEIIHLVPKESRIELISGKFIGNTAEGMRASGGAVYNGWYNTEIAGHIDKIVGEFTENAVRSDKESAVGGAVKNDSYIGTIIADFNRNSASALSDNTIVGSAAVSNTGFIDHIQGNFTENKLTARNETTWGGILSNNGGVSGKILSIEGDFIQNTASSQSGVIAGGILLNKDNYTIDKIQGNFIQNVVVSQNGFIQGGIVNNYSKTSTLTFLKSDFTNNDISSVSNAVSGGSIYNNGSVQKIESNFENNTVKSTGKNIYGGNIYNEKDGNINILDGNFKENKSESVNGFIYGGILYNNQGSIKNITGNFENNNIGATYVLGGLTYNNGYIHLLNSSFAQNTVTSNTGYIWGGIVNNAAALDVLRGSVNNNNFTSAALTYGGAFYNGAIGIIDTIQTDFQNNHLLTKDKDVYGGLIWNQGDINNLSGNYVQNKIKTTSGILYGGLLYNQKTIKNITSRISDNRIENTSGNIVGGLILNVGMIDEMSVQFNNNHIETQNGAVYGGLLYNSGNIKNIINSNFVNNHIAGNQNSLGGVIYSVADLKITAKADTSLFSGNVTPSSSDSVFMAGTADNPVSLSLSAVENGKIVFDDTINGQSYDMIISGDKSGETFFKNTVKNVNHLTLSDTLHLGHNAIIQTHQLSAQNTPILMVDVSSDNNQAKSGQIQVSGDIQGQYNVIVNSLTPTVPTDKQNSLTPFIKAENDDITTSSDFTVSRVIGSPFMWESTLKESDWYLQMTDNQNPDYPHHQGREVTPETLAGISLSTIALAQTGNIFRQIENQTSLHHHSTHYGENSGDTERNSWVSVQGEKAHDNRETDIKTTVWSVDGGFDIHRTNTLRTGFFASYRKGKYDIKGKGKNYFSPVGSDVDAKSFSGGLYYQYETPFNRLFASVYGGIQKSDIITDDKIGSFDTKAKEFGLAFSYEHTLVRKNRVSIRPSVGIYYTSVIFDDAKDKIGKTYVWDDLHNIETEAGLTIATEFHGNEFYFKPSVLQNFINDADVNISGLNHISTQDNRTLARMSFGWDYYVNDMISMSLWGRYTFGDDYHATAGGIEAEWNF